MLAGYRDDPRVGELNSCVGVNLSENSDIHVDDREGDCLNDVETDEA